MPINFGLTLVLLLAMAVSSVPAGVQSNSTIAGKITDLIGNSMDSAVEDLPPANDTEMSSIDSVVINEVELNPRDTDAGREWIELYNPSSAVNVSDFKIRTSLKSATIQLPQGAMIEANETYMVELEGQVLSNTAESLVLENGLGEVIDRTPSLADRSDDGRTWQRIPDGYNEWQFAEGTKEELNDPDGHASVTRSARSGSAECQGTAGCAEGIVTRIVDGDTIYVRVNGTTYRVDLALASAPSRTEDGYAESTSFTRNLCLGSNVLVDQDDDQLTSLTSIMAVVYCESTRLNSELLDSGHATLDMDQCETSEFAGQRWARDHGC